MDAPPRELQQKTYASGQDQSPFPGLPAASPEYQAMHYPEYQAMHQAPENTSNEASSASDSCMAPGGALAERRVLATACKK